MRHPARLIILAFAIHLASNGPLAAAAADGSLDLQGALRLALARQPGLAAAVDRARAASRDADARAAALWPQIGVRAGDLFSSTRGGVVDFAAANGPREITGQLVVDQWLFNRGAREALAAAYAGAASARFRTQATRLAVAEAVARTYFTLAGQRDAVETWQAAERTADATLAATRQAFAAGTRARIDVMRAEAALAQARLGLATARAQEASTADLLGLVTGLTPLPPLEPPPPIAPGFALPGMEALEAEAVKEAPALALTRSEADRQAALLKSARAERLPVVGLEAALGWDTLASPLDVGPGWSAGVFLTVPVATSGALRAAEDSARFRLAAARADVRQARLALRERLVQARGEAATALADVRADAQIVPAKAEVARITEEGYAAGRVSSLELSLAQQDSVQARLSLDAATAALRFALARLDLLTGKLPGGETR